MNALKLPKFSLPQMREIQLPSSKSISNRVLLIEALLNSDFGIENLSAAKDTQTLLKLLETKPKIYDVGHAGTTFRFLTAYLSIQNNGTRILTGSARMKERPIAILVEALQQLGAKISYLERIGFPPLQIGEFTYTKTKEISVSGGVSSQYISALLLIAPLLEEGLELRLLGRIVSKPYIEMTLSLMEVFGISYTVDDNTISIPNQKYHASSFRVEGDWSGASYWYAMLAFSKVGTQLFLLDLKKDSIQGDAAIAKIMVDFGVNTEYKEEGILITKTSENKHTQFEYDFSAVPDLAQTIAVVCAGLGISASLTGLDTLRIKETDRILALATELKKLGIRCHSTKNTLSISGKAIPSNQLIRTYKDHRMALAFACFAVLGDITIEDRTVIQKSYPSFWQDIRVVN